MNVTGGPELRGHGHHGSHGEAEGDATATATAITAPHVPTGRVTKARRVTPAAITAGAMITAVTTRGMRIPMITAVTAGPPSEQYAVAGSRRGTAVTAVTA